MRLVPPALAGWAAAAVGLVVPGAAAAAGAVSCCAVAVALLVASRGRRRELLVAVATALLAAAAAGGGAALHSADVRRGPVPALVARHATATVAVTVTGDPFRVRPKVHGAQRMPGTVMFRAEATRVESRYGAPGTRTRTPVLVALRQGDGAPSAEWLRLLPSTVLRVRAELAPPAAGRDIAAVLRVRSEDGPRQVRAPSTMQRVAGGLRSGLRDAAAGLDRDERGLLPGIVVGDVSRVPSDLDAAFRATDMTHLLAVSGSNLMIMLSLLIGPPGRAQLAERRGLAPRLGISLRGTAVCAALLTLGFVLVCRPDASVLRAAACGGVTILAIATGRRRSLLPALAAAVLLLVLLDPWLALDFGFLLSVLATGALLTLGPRWSAALRRAGIPPRLAEPLAAAAAAQAVCAPVVAVLAAHVSLVAVPCNLLAEFVVAPATVLGFAALAVAPFAMPVAEWLAWLASWPVGGIARIARTGASLPGAEIGWPGSWTGAFWLTLVTVTLFFLAVRIRLLQHPWWCALCVLALLLALIRPVPLVRPLTGWPPAGWRIVACDVGQGDALVLATGADHSAVLVDAGPDPEAVDRCLRTLGVTTVPLVVLTHFHADHVTGLPGVLKGRSVGGVQTTTLDEPSGQAQFVRRTARAAGVPVTTAAAGERRSSGTISWEVLWPPPAVGPPGGLPGPGPPPVDNANDASVTLLVRSAGLTFFLAGDLEPDAQRRLLTANPSLPQADVVKIAHHGSAYQHPALLRRLSPRIALISAGTDNPYGHPAPRTLTALRTAGAVVPRTDVHGALAVTRNPDGGGPAVVTEHGTPRPPVRWRRRTPTRRAQRLVRRSGAQERRP